MKNKFSPILIGAIVAMLVWVSALQAQAQTTGPVTKEKLAELHRQTRAWKSYRIDFRVTMELEIPDDKTSQATEGKQAEQGANAAAGKSGQAQQARKTKEVQKFDGSYEMSGASFRIVMPEVELFSDWETKWEVNLTYKEITVDTVSAQDRNILADPAQFFDRLGEGISIEILKIVPYSVPGANFRFDAARYPDFEVIDFR